MADPLSSSDEGERRSLITPEGVDLDLRLAGRGQRLAAFLLDLLIMVGTLIVATIAIGVGAYSIGRHGGEIGLIVWLLGFFVLRNCYFILLEMGPRAATWGKRAVGLRVVARSGGRLTADAVIARNLLREIEFFLPLVFLIYGMVEQSVGALAALFGLGWACLFLFFPFFNKDRLRIGDLLAGTWVINAPKRSLGLDLLAHASPALTFTEAQLDAYGIYELQTLEQVLRGASPETLNAVADTIRTKIDYPYTPDDSAFLNAYYEALRARLERNLLFGRRRRDKHDRAA
jgi:uncharacterized RDD family membrane protein YckC